MSVLLRGVKSRASGADGNLHQLDEGVGDDPGGGHSLASWPSKCGKAGVHVGGCVASSPDRASDESCGREPHQHRLGGCLLSRLSR